MWILGRSLQFLIHACTRLQIFQCGSEETVRALSMHRPITMKDALVAEEPTAKTLNGIKAGISAGAPSTAKASPLKTLIEVDSVLSRHCYCTILEYLLRTVTIFLVSLWLRTSFSLRLYKDVFPLAWFIHLPTSWYSSAKSSRYQYPLKNLHDILYGIDICMWRTRSFLLSQGSQKPVSKSISKKREVPWLVLLCPCFDCTKQSENFRDTVIGAEGNESKAWYDRVLFLLRLSAVRDEEEKRSPLYRTWKSNYF